MRFKRIKVSVPGKLMLLGEHSVIYDRPCLVATVDWRCEVQAKRISKSELKIKAKDKKVVNYRRELKQLNQPEAPREVRFIEMTVKDFRRSYGFDGGVEIETRNKFSSEYGLGSSAAVTVGVMQALHGLFGPKVSKRKLFKECLRVIREVQRLGSGFDVAAAIYGGIIYFVTGGGEIKPLRFKELPIVVGYTGLKADTVSLVEQVEAKWRQEQQQTESLFDEITNLVEAGKEAIIKNQWNKLGELMNLNQKKLENLGVSSKRLDGLIKAVREAGAWGAKLSGAGRGDCMVAVVEKTNKKAVEWAIEQAGGKVLPVELGVEGVRVEGKR